MGNKARDGHPNFFLLPVSSSSGSSSMMFSVVSVDLSGALSGGRSDEALLGDTISVERRSPR